MKTKPEEAVRRAEKARVKTVEVVVRNRMSKDLGRKETVLIVDFSLESEGRVAHGRYEESRETFIHNGDTGKQEAIPGSRKNWKCWSASHQEMWNAVLTIVYGAKNARIDPMCTSSRQVEWYANRLQREVTKRARRSIATKRIKDVIETLDRREDRRDMMTELKSTLTDLMKRFPHLRQQDLLKAVEEVRNERTVREVMEG